MVRVSSGTLVCGIRITLPLKCCYSAIFQMKRARDLCVIILVFEVQVFLIANFCQMQYLNFFHVLTISPLAVSNAV
ncbi:hypothetical protein DPMN_090663 [Dreissena polymorpha]|uniref:Uncharacterized protein n=1 Tax=Dreissena polymorpha TaxID=45954 RepID=A0A9D4KZ17_DREPO|nr:hypothetical protein DPMN_090663 [Dreissena polymorpha]